METNFQVGQVWRNRDGKLARIELVQAPAHDGFPTKSTFGWHNSDGAFILSGYPGDDLVELVMNADGTPEGSDIKDADASLAEPIKLPCDPSRTEFIDKLTHDVFTSPIMLSVAEAYVRAAVKLRDELVRGDS